MFHPFEDAAFFAGGVAVTALVAHLSLKSLAADAHAVATQAHELLDKALEVLTHKALAPKA